MANHDPDLFDPAGFARLEALLDRVLELEGAAREQFLGDLGREDADLRARLEALVAADSARDALLDGELGPLAARLLEDGGDGATAGDFKGWRLGPWRLLREIGRGGMGAVWLAERADGAYEQRVALKLVPAAVASRDLYESFERERRILARLEHPLIARLLDGGVSEDGLPWLAMEFVEGQPLTQWCEVRRSDLATRLRLFESVAAAVAAAHQRLVVHRDLKPSNVLVTPAGEARLLDFGIARLLEPGSEGAEATRPEPWATPRYAAPEQLRGEPPTTATDVWALGVMLYVLLTGRHPFTASGAGDMSVGTAVLEHEPPPPSRVAAEGQGPVPAGALHGDLDAIVLRTLRKDPDARYASVQALLDDLHRYRTHRPVRAVARSAQYLATKWLRRNRGPAMLVSLSVLVLFAGLFATSREARIAAAQRDRADRMMKFLVAVLSGAGPERPSKGPAAAGSADPDRPIRAVVAEAAVRARRELADDPAALAAVELALGEALLAMRRDAEADTVLADAAASYLRARDGKGRADALHLRALALINASRPAAAESLAREAVEFWRRKPGDELEKAVMLMTLSRAQARLRDPRADSSLSVAWALIDAHAPQAHALRVEALNARAIQALGAGREAEAESLYRVVVALSTRVHGALHPITLTGRANYANSLYLRKRWAEAESSLRSVANDREQVLGPDHPDVTNPLNTLAMCLRDMGRLAEADTLFRSVIERRASSLGPEARETLVSESGLANVLRLEGRPAEAEAIVRRVLDIRRRQLPANDPLIASSLASLGESLEAQRRWGDAEVAWREALAIREASVSPKPQEIAKAKAALERLAALRP